MKNFKRTFFIILTITIALQTFRHCYMNFFAHTESIVDKYDETQQLISKTQSLEELEILYQNELDKEDSNDLYEYSSAIRKIEGINESIREVWFYWLIGICSIFIGIIVHEKWQKWLGATLIIIGFLEITFWTSPLSSYLVGNLGFGELLTTKLMLSAISAFLIIIVWFYEENRNNK